MIHYKIFLVNTDFFDLVTLNKTLCPTKFCKKPYFENFIILHNYTYLCNMHK